MEAVLLGRPPNNQAQVQLLFRNQTHETSMITIIIIIIIIIVSLWCGVWCVRVRRVCLRTRARVCVCVRVRQVRVR